MAYFTRKYTINECRETPRTSLPSTYVAIRMGDGAALFIGPGAHMAVGQLPTDLRLRDALDYLFAETAPLATP